MKILFIPDCQVKDGVPLDHLAWLGRYAVEKRPDVIVQAGDFADMPSLSSYDVGKKVYEGRRYRKDVDAVRKGMGKFLLPILRQCKYKPRLILTLGNHEDRITRAVESDAKLEGTISLADLGYEDAGWTVSPYLKPIKIAGVHFAHFFPSGIMGRPCTSARKILNTFHVSCVAGHQQGREVAYAKRGDGKKLTAIIAGSFYQHREEFLGPMGNYHWRGVVMLHEVRDGQFDEMFVSLNFLKKKFK